MHIATSPRSSRSPGIQAERTGRLGRQSPRTSRKAWCRWPNERANGSSSCAQGHAVPKRRFRERSGVLSGADVVASGGGIAVGADLRDRKMGHEPHRYDAVPVILTGFDEAVDPRAYHLDRPAAPPRLSAGPLGHERVLLADPSFPGQVADRADPDRSRRRDHALVLVHDRSRLRGRGHPQDRSSPCNEDLGGSRAGQPGHP